MTTFGRNEPLWGSGFPDFRIDQADADGVFHHLDGVAEIELSQDIGPVLFHGLGADAEDVADLGSLSIFSFSAILTTPDI